MKEILPPTPAVESTATQNLARTILDAVGWRVAGSFPDLPKYVLVGAPHTSNWDLPLALLLKFSTGVHFSWIAKDSLFKGPMGGVYRGLGGIPVRRDRSSNFVSQIVQKFEEASRLVIAIAPEGTRSRVAHWKTGFYYMALGAQVPIVMGFVDYPRKEVGVGPLLQPTGDLEADFAVMRAFYATKTGRYPEKQGTIEVRPGE
jgi:1-acyl-sn-glycerol-3-phosphate acyltransferase